MKTFPPESRRKQVVTGALIIGAVGFLLVLFWLGRHIPGIVGEWFGLVVGIATSPFLMPVCFVLLGLFVVNTLNAWRRHQEGDEFVYLETVDSPDRDSLPEAARSVIYNQPPTPGEQPSPIDQLEGALAIQDYDSACELLAEMPAKVRDRPEILRLRVTLAESTGKSEMARQLRAQLKAH